jgi:hypothetical protein
MPLLTLNQLSIFMKTAKNSAAEAYDALLSFKFRVTGAIKIIPTIF